MPKDARKPTEEELIGTWVLRRVNGEPAPEAYVLRLYAAGGYTNTEPGFRYGTLNWGLRADTLMLGVEQGGRVYDYLWQVGILPDGTLYVITQYTDEARIYEKQVMIG